MLDVMARNEMEEKRVREAPCVILERHSLGESIIECRLTFTSSGALSAHTLSLQMGKLSDAATNETV